jgi:predicted nucleic acid-binding protein
MNGELAFIDTNVLVYAYDTAAGEKHEIAKSLLAEMWQHPGRVFLSVQVLQELYVTLIRKGTTSPRARAIVSQFNVWPIISTDWQLVEQAMQNVERWQLSFWDGLIVAAAKKAGAVHLYSEDFSEGQNFDGLVVSTPIKQTNQDL